MTENLLEIVCEENLAILKIDGEIIFDNSNSFKEESKKRISEKNCDHLIIDLSKVPYIDSSGIGFILSLFKFMRTQGGKLVIANANQKIKKVFEITKMTQVFQMYDNIEEAIENLKK